MSDLKPLSRCRRPTVQTWVGVALVAFLVLSEACAITHEYDRTAHSGGQPCAVCVTAASFSTGAVSVPLYFEPIVAAPISAPAAIATLVSVVPTRRYARGPPAVSFTL